MIFLRRKPEYTELSWTSTASGCCLRASAASVKAKPRSNSFTGDILLVADDAVELKVIKDTIQGSSPDKIQDFIELRGVGFINVRNMYGVAGILRKTNVDLVIELVEYEKSHDYERSDAPMRTYNVLGVEIPKLIVPVIMGRNLAIIVEVAAKNFRLKQMGYDANEELIERMNRD